jgi:hypothetical protein
MDKETLKQIAISILVGAVTAFITTLLQGILDYVNHVQRDLIGGAGASVYYLKQWITNPTG